MPVPRFRSRARLSVQPLEGRDVPNGTITASLSPTGVLTLTGDDNDNDVVLTETGANLNLTSTGGTQFTGPTSFALASVKSIKANLLGGVDSLSIDPAADFTVPGPVSISLGDGGNVATPDALNLVTTGKITLGGLSVTGGDGYDAVSISGGAGSTIGGTTKLSYANGGSSTTLNGTGFSAVTLTAGDAITNPNIVSATGVTVTKTFSAALGNSFPADLDFTGSTVGTLKASGFSVSSLLTSTTVNAGISYKAGASLDIQGDGLTVTGNVTLSAPNASFGGTNGAIVLNGNLSLTSSAGTDTEFQTTAPSEVKGNISVKGGWFNDVFKTNGNFKADKNITLNLAGGDNVVAIGDGTGLVTVLGKGSITTGDGNDMVTFDEVTWTGPITLKTGGGADFLSVEDGSTFMSTFTADLGNGDDTISIAQDTAADGSPGPTTFTGLTKITAGAGNDSLFLGLAQGAPNNGDANSRVVFSTPGSVIDGGLGLDFFDPTSAQFTGAATPNWT
jgi:hypothetical protein